MNASKLVLSPQALYWANPNDKSFATKLCSEWIIKGTTLSLSFLEEIGDPISSTHHTLTETRLYLNQRSTALESIALLKAIKKYAENNKRLIILSNRTSDSAISLQVTAKGKIECYDPNIGFIHFTENDWPEFFSALKAFYRTKRVDMLAIIDPQKSPSYLTHYASTFYYGEKNSSLRIFKSLKEQNSYLSKIYFVIALIFFQLVVTSNQSLSHNTQVLSILLLGYGFFFLSEYFLDAIQLEGLNAFLTANCHPSSNMDTENLMNDNIGPKPQTAAILPFFNGATTTLSKERVHNFMGQIAK